MALAALTGGAVPVGAVTGVISVVASGSFDSLPGGATVAGVVSPAGAQQFPYSFTATCNGAACATTGYTYTWSFGDGASTTSTSSAGASHAYAAPGVYTATLTVSSSTGYGTGSVRVLVSPRFSDADASTNTAGDASPPDRAAIWTVAAYQIMTACRGATTSLGAPSQSRGAFCVSPTPNPQAAALSESSVTNGATGVSCLTAASLGPSYVLPPYENCGLDPSAFLTLGSGASGNPLNTCGSTCESALVAANQMSSGGALLLNTANCGDGWVAQQQGTNYSAIPGVENGCVSRGQFYQALVTALYGGTPTTGSPLSFSSSQLASAASACPGDAASLSGSPYASYVERAAALGLTTTWLGTTSCDLNAPITKGEAYRIIAQATGTPNATSCSGYRDLTDETLGHGAVTPDPQCLADLALVATGVPVVDSTTCVDGGGGTCFNPYDPLSRGGLATLLASLVNGLPTPTGVAYNPSNWTANVDASALYNGYVIQSSPSAFYELNDTSSAAYDASGNNAYGTYAGTFSHGAPGPLAGTSAGSVGLSGSGYVQIPSPYGGTGGTTTTLWFQSTGNGPLIAGQSAPVGGSPNSSVVYLALRGGRLVTGMVNRTSALGSNGPASAQVVNDGNWHQVTYVTSATGTLSLYLDGNLIAQSTASDSRPATTYAQIGAGYSAGTWSYFTGLIAGVATWGSALSSSQVRGLWSASGRSNPWGVFAGQLTTPTPWGAWRMNGAATTGCTPATGAGGVICGVGSPGPALTIATGSASTCGAVAGTGAMAANQTGSGPTNDTTSQEIQGRLGPCVASSGTPFSGVSAFTLSAWVKFETGPASSSGTPSDVISAVTGSQHTSLSVNSSCENYAAGGLSLEISNGSWLVCATAASVLTTPGAWYQVTAVWNDPTNSPLAPSQITLYVNKASATLTTKAIGTPTSGPINLGPVTVGGSASNAAYDLFGGTSQRGALADVAIYSTALSANQITTQYCAALDNVATTAC